MYTLNNNFLVTCGCGGADNDDTGDTTDNVDNDEASGDISLVMSLLYLSRGGLNIIAYIITFYYQYRSRNTCTVLTSYSNTIISNIQSHNLDHKTFFSHSLKFIWESLWTYYPGVNEYKLQTCKTVFLNYVLIDVMQNGKKTR